jgi:hypothetical protein
VREFYGNEHLFLNIEAKPDLAFFGTVIISKDWNLRGFSSYIQLQNE